MTGSALRLRISYIITSILLLFLHTRTSNALSSTMLRLPRFLSRRPKLLKARSDPVTPVSQVPIVSQAPSSAGLFGNLPYELRRIIYLYALASQPSIITIANGSNTRNPGILTPRNWLPYIDPQNNRTMHGIPLLRTCRQIYMETSPILYGCNTYEVCCEENLLLFWEFSRMLTQHCLDLITSVRINYSANTFTLVNDLRLNIFLSHWRQLWRILAKQMPGLERLRMNLTKRYPPLRLALDEDWVVPMLEVRGLKEFELRLNMELGSEESTADHNRMLDRFQDELRASMCSLRLE